MSGLLFKLLGFILLSAALAVLLRQRSGEFSFMISISAAAAVTVALLFLIKSPIEAIRIKLEGHGIKTEYFKIALKAVGIGYVTTFVADACRDGGQTSLADRAEFAGKCAVFILCCPLFISVLETAVGFIK